VIISVIVREKNLYQHISNYDLLAREREIERELFESSDQTPLDFCLCNCVEERSLQKKVDTADELLASILDAAGCIKKREDQLRRTARHLDTAVAKCTEVDGGKFGNI
jgi:hypothetical protein